jgi:hypothetical protein
MMRFQPAIASLLGGVLLLGVAGDGEIRTLEDALSATSRALEVLHDLAGRLERDPQGSIGLLLSATEPPALEERARDERLESLRDEVNLLQMELDAADEPLALAAPPPAALPAGDGVGGLTTGLDETLRRLLAQDLEHAPLRPSEARTSGTPAVEERPVSPEGEGYSADPLHHAIACHRAGRFEEALALLPADSADPEMLYWRGRTLEKLERLDEAIETLGRVASRADLGSLAERARTDLEFLEWKRDFLARRHGEEQR